MKKSSIYMSRLVIIISLFFLTISFTLALMGKSKVPGYKLIKKENAGTDITGGTIRKEYYQSKQSFLEITIISDVEIKGEIVAVGNAGFTSLIIQTETRGSLYLPHEYKEQYWQKQGKTIKLSGTIEKRVVKNKESGRTLSRNWFFPED